MYFNETILPDCSAYLFKLGLPFTQSYSYYFLIKLQPFYLLFANFLSTSIDDLFQQAFLHKKSFLLSVDAVLALKFESATKIYTYPNDLKVCTQKYIQA